MKKIISVLLVMVLALGVFAGCGASTNLQGTTEEIIKQMNEKIETPEKINSSITAESSEFLTGLTAEFFKENIESGTVSEPMIGGAHSMVVLKVNSGVSPADVAEIMLDKLNLNRWIRMSAEELYVCTSGDYVISLMSSSEMVDSAEIAFKELAGKVGDAQFKVA